MKSGNNAISKTLYFYFGLVLFHYVQREKTRKIIRISHLVSAVTAFQEKIDIYDENIYVLKFSLSPSVSFNVLVEVFFYSRSAQKPSMFAECIISFIQFL